MGGSGGGWLGAVLVVRVMWVVGVMWGSGGVGVWRHGFVHVQTVQPQSVLLCIPRLGTLIGFLTLEAAAGK